MNTKLDRRNSIIKAKSEQKIWTNEEDAALIDVYDKYKNASKKWKKISTFLGSKSPKQCYSRYRQINPNFKQGTWSREEEQKLQNLVKRFGKNWSSIAKVFKTRSSKQIRHHYINILEETNIRTPFTNEEDNKVKELYLKYGKKWKQISTFLSGRTGDSVKNRFYNKIKFMLDSEKINQENGQTLTCYDATSSSKNSVPMSVSNCCESEINKEFERCSKKTTNNKSKKVDKNENRADLIESQGEMKVQGFQNNEFLPLAIQSGQHRSFDNPIGLGMINFNQKSSSQDQMTYRNSNQQFSYCFPANNMNEYSANHFKHPYDVRGGISHYNLPQIIDNNRVIQDHLIMNNNMHFSTSTNYASSDFYGNFNPYFSQEAACYDANQAISSQQPDLTKTINSLLQTLNASSNSNQSELNYYYQRSVEYIFQNLLQSQGSYLTKDCTFTNSSKMVASNPQVNNLETPFNLNSTNFNDFKFNTTLDLISNQRKVESKPIKVESQSVKVDALSIDVLNDQYNCDDMLIGNPNQGSNKNTGDYNNTNMNVTNSNYSIPANYSYINGGMYFNNNQSTGGFNNFMS